MIVKDSIKDTDILNIAWEELQNLSLYGWRLRSSSTEESLYIQYCDTGPQF